MVGRQYFPFIQVYWSLLVIFNITWIDGLLRIPLPRWCSSARAWRHCAGRPTTASSCFQARWFNIWGWMGTFIMCIYITYHLSVGGWTSVYERFWYSPGYQQENHMGLSENEVPLNPLLYHGLLSFSRTRGGYTSCHCQTRPYIYTHTYIHTYVRTYVRTYIRTYIRTYVHTYIRTYVHTYIRTYVLAYIQTDIHTYIPLHTYHYIHTITYIALHTYIHSITYIPLHT